MVPWVFFNPFLVRWPLFCFLSLHLSLQFLEFYINGILCLVSYAQHNYVEIHHVVCIKKFISFYCLVIFHCMGVLPFVYPSTCWWEHLGCSGVCLSQTKLLWMFVYKRYLPKYLLGEWLGHTVNVYLTFSEITKLFSKVVIPFIFPLVVCKSSCYSTSLPTFGMVNFLKF